MSLKSSFTLDRSGYGTEALTEVTTWRVCTHVDHVNRTKSQFGQLSIPQVLIIDQHYLCFCLAVILSVHQGSDCPGSDCLFFFLFCFFLGGENRDFSNFWCILSGFPHLLTLQIWAKFPCNMKPQYVASFSSALGKPVRLTSVTETPARVVLTFLSGQKGPIPFAREMRPTETFLNLFSNTMAALSCPRVTCAAVYVSSFTVLICPWLVMHTATTGKRKMLSKCGIYVVYPGKTLPPQKYGTWKFC